MSGVRRALSTAEVPIKQVAAIYRMNIGDEAGAVAMDAFVNEQAASLAAAPGYVKTVRSLCKSEWAYEVYFVFDGLGSFKTYKQSPLRLVLKERTEPAFNKIGVMMEDVYQGVRVFDDF